MKTVEFDSAVNIIQETFSKNPSVNVVIGSSGNQSKKLKRLSEYAVLKGLSKNGLYCSSDGAGVAIVFHSNNKNFSFKETMAEFKFAMTLKPSLILNTLLREKYIKQNRLKTEHLYFWFLGVKRNNEGAVFELKNKIFQRADELELPILLETSVNRNVEAYKRYGFETYHSWLDDNHVNLRFMVRHPKK